ncbi:MAG: glycosyltransferase family 39 protein, partial [Chloroflexi bacterium]|nr:glycosyltransferase family 39 protein [Chloroflexota bacterium]
MIDPVESSLDTHQDKTWYTFQVFPRFTWKVYRAHGVVAGLIVVLLIGAVLRLTGLNWDENQHLHPDERFLTMVETALAWPTSIGEYFDSARSPLNPYNRGSDTFVYGTLPLFLTKAAGDLVKMPGYDGIHLVGRALSALFDLGSVILIFLIGRRLYSNRVGLLAALLLSLSVLNIQQSHFFTVDTFATFFVALFFFFIIQVAENGSLASFLLAGAALGLSLASKISTYPLGGIAVLAAAIYILKLRADPGFGESIVLAAGAMAARLGLLFAVAFLVFRVGQPYAFIGPGFFGFAPSGKFLKDVFFVSQLMSGAIDYPPGHQWAFRAPVLFAGKNTVLWGMGLPLGLAAWAGCLLAAADAYKRRH